MKKIIILGILCIASYSWGSNCRVVEYPDRNEVVCENNIDESSILYVYSPWCGQVKQDEND